jgi:hypothetical protein
VYLLQMGSLSVVTCIVSCFQEEGNRKCEREARLDVSLHARPLSQVADVNNGYRKRGLCPVPSGVKTDQTNI